MTIDKEKVTKHRNNLLKTVEGTGWILCDAINYMAKNNIVPEKNPNKKESFMAQNIAEIFEIISECEDDAVIDHLADKLLEYAGKDKDKLIDYLSKYMGDNPLYKRVIENSRELH